MKRFPTLIAAVCLMGCGTTTYHLSQKRSNKKVRVTYYCPAEDKRWGSKTASGVRGQPGVTVAAAKSVPFGSPVAIPALAPVFGDENFVVQDRGTDVNSAKAGRQFGCEVIDVMCKSRKMMKHLAAVMPPLLEVTE